MEARKKGAEVPPRSRMSEVADFVTLAAAQRCSDELIGHALDVLTQSLGVRHAVFLAVSPSQDSLVVHALKGWEGEALEGHHHVLELAKIASMPSPGKELVELERLDSRPSFLPNALLREQTLCCGLAALLHAGVLSLGVIAVLSETRRRFTNEEKDFVRSITGILAGAIMSDGSESRYSLHVQQALAAKREWLAALDGLRQLVFLLDDSGIVLRTNRAIKLLGNGTVFESRGRDVHEFLHPGCESEHCTVRSVLRRVCDKAQLRGGSEEDIWDADLNRCWRVRATRCRGIEPAQEQAMQPSIVLSLDDVTAEKKEWRNLIDDMNELQSQAAVLQQRVSELTASARRGKVEQKRLRREVIEAQEAERRRVASELHDGIGQSLTALKLWIEANRAVCASDAGNETTVSLFNSTVRRVQHTIEEVRRIALNLRPSMLDDLGLVVTLNWLCREFSADRSGLQVVKEINCEDEQVPDALKTVIFRISQEALNNVARHAAASRVELALTCKDGIISLRISDNGRGFPAKEPLANAGLGLKGMRERAETSGGLFRLVSSPDGGTRIDVFWAERDVQS